MYLCCKAGKHCKAFSIEPNDPDLHITGTHSDYGMLHLPAKISDWCTTVMFVTVNIKGMFHTEFVKIL
jgi:hypothetical protein